MGRRKSLSKQEHEALGQELQKIHRRLEEILLPHTGRYGVNGKTTRKCLRAIEAVNEVRWQFDNEAARDLGGEFETRLYFPTLPPGAGNHARQSDAAVRSGSLTTHHQQETHTVPTACAQETQQ